MSRSNIGRVLEKINSGEAGAVGEVTHEPVSRQRRFEYEDGVIARSVEARDQIRNTSQPFLFDQKQLDENHLVSSGGYNDPFVAVLRDIRNKVNLGNSGLGSTIMVTSVGDTGQSRLLARNLAAVLASDENRTSVLLELQSTGSVLVGAQGEVPGFIDFAHDEHLNVGEVLHPTGVPRMKVIPYGSKRESTQELLRSTRLRILIKDITRRYPRDRHTIMDAPAIDRVADVELLNEYADKIILCIPYGKVTPTELKKTLQKIDNNKLLGTVLVGAPGIGESAGLGE